MSDFSKYMAEALEQVLVEGIKYTDVSSSGTIHETCKFIRRDNGDFFFESGIKIIGKDEESLSGRFDMGFYVPMENQE